MSARVLLLPGYGDSGPAHWQSRWLQKHSDFVRVQQRDWHRPVSCEWVAALDVAVAGAAAGVILVAHSLACLTVAQWGGSINPHTASLHPRIAAALLVAPPDPCGTHFPVQAQGFDQLPQNALPFKTIVVVSNNDPYDQTQCGARLAALWGSNVVRLDQAGHINADSGLGEWPAGLALLAQLGYSLPG